MDKQPIFLWYTRPEAVSSEEDIEACASLLSEDEQARSRSFRFNRHRHEYLMSRFLLRTALSCFHPLAPEAWRFQLNSYGKPSVDPDCGLRFNLSHSPRLAACLIGRNGEVGVDVEPYERAGEIVEIAAEIFSPPERAQLEGLHGQPMFDRALSLWTLKEAYIKARGMGLSLPLMKFSFLFDEEEGVRLELDPDLGDEFGRWRFCLLDIAGHRCALLAELGTDPELQLWEAKPSLQPVMQLADGDERWFPYSRPSH